MADGKNLSVNTPTQIYELARSGDAASQVAWALCLKQGRGVRRDANAAIEWLQKASDQDYPEALYQLAKCAETGIGLLQSDSKAAEYYKKAASLGHQEAQYAYAMCLLGGLGCTYNPTEAEEWLKAASDAGFAPAANYLSTMNSSPATVYSDTQEEQYSLEEENTEKGQPFDESLKIEETAPIETTNTIDIPPASEPEYEEKTDIDIQYLKDRSAMARVLSDIKWMDDVIAKEGPGYVTAGVKKKYESLQKEAVRLNDAMNAAPDLPPFIIRNEKDRELYNKKARFQEIHRKIRWHYSKDDSKYSRDELREHRKEFDSLWKEAEALENEIHQLESSKLESDIQQLESNEGASGETFLGGDSQEKAVTVEVVSDDTQMKEDAQEVQNPTAAAANDPNTAAAPRRSGMVFMIVMAVAGCVSGGLLKNTFGQNAANVHFTNSGDYTAFMVLFGGAIGLLIALLLKKVYVNAKDGLPFYGLVLLLPLVIFLLSAAALEILIALWNITVGFVKLVLTVLVVVIIFAIAIYVLGS